MGPKALFLIRLWPRLGSPLVWETQFDATKYYGQGCKEAFLSDHSIYRNLTPHIVASVSDSMCYKKIIIIINIYCFQLK